MTMMMMKSVAVYKGLARARRIYVDDGTAVVVTDTGSVEKTLAGCL